MSFWGLTLQGMANELISGKKGGRWCPIRSANKRTHLQDFNYFSIMFYYNISTTYKNIGDLFCSVIFLDFHTVWDEPYTWFLSRPARKELNVSKLKSSYNLSLIYIRCLIFFKQRIQCLFHVWRNFKTSWFTFYSWVDWPMTCNNYPWSSGPASFINKI